MVRQPVFLPCGHILCSSCIQTIKDVWFFPSFHPRRCRIIHWNVLSVTLLFNSTSSHSMFQRSILIWVWLFRRDSGDRRAFLSQFQAQIHPTNSSWTADPGLHPQDPAVYSMDTNVRTLKSINEFSSWFLSSSPFNKFISLVFNLTARCLRKSAIRSSINSTRRTSFLSCCSPWMQEASDSISFGISFSCSSHAWAEPVWCLFVIPGGIPLWKSKPLIVFIASGRLDQCPSTSCTWTTPSKSRSKNSKRRRSASCKTFSISMANRMTIDSQSTSSAPSLTRDLSFVVFKQNTSSATDRFIKIHVHAKRTNSTF